MNCEQFKLREVLQALALPVTGQLRLYPNEVCKVGRLIQEFEQIDRLFFAKFGDNLTRDQRVLLNDLRQNLRCVCLEYKVEFACSDVFLRRCQTWRKVRHLARSSLLAFDWTLTLPTLVEPV